jgi:anti-sigma B factor antagonist
MAFKASRTPSGVTVITVEGQLIVANRQDLKQQVQDALDRGERKFLFDFTKTSDRSSS